MVLLLNCLWAPASIMLPLLNREESKDIFDGVGFGVCFLTTSGRTLKRFLTARDLSAERFQSKWIESGIHGEILQTGSGRFWRQWNTSWVVWCLKL